MLKTICQRTHAYLINNIKRYFNILKSSADDILRCMIGMSVIKSTIYTNSYKVLHLLV